MATDAIKTKIPKEVRKARWKKVKEYNKILKEFKKNK